jgi:cysteine desulfurase
MDSGSRGEAMDERVYLDWNATAPLAPAARAAMAAALDLVGNPSSIHAEGRAARAVIEQARDAIAGLVGAAAADVIFTSGGTEANAMALTPRLAWSGGQGCTRLMVSAIEHPSVLAGGQFSEDSVEFIGVGSDGVIDLGILTARLEALAAAGESPLVSVMLANNETGVLQPVAAVADLAHRTGGLLHVDAVQAGGRIDIDIKALGADLLSLSGHKMGGPKGVGALVRGRGDLHFPLPLIRGGGQERRLRAGTENVAAIAGMAAAIATMTADRAADRRHMLALRERLEAGLKEASPDVIIFGAGADRLPNTTLCAVPGLAAETALIAFDLAGIAVSSGSACSSGKVTPSHVLAAMGVGADLARGAIRVSFGRATTPDHIDRFLKSWRSTVARLDKSSKKGQGGLAA